VSRSDERGGSDPLGDVAVVIVTYRSAPVISRALNGLPTERLADCVVVDNASDDETVAVVRGLARPGVKLVALSDNRGFGAGNNEGAKRAASCRWLLFLNPDAVIDASNLEKLIDYAQKHRSVGVVAPRLWSGGNPITSAGRLATVASEVRGLLPPALARWLPNRRYDADYDATGRVGHVEGACMLIDAARFREIGGFDEQFFLFFEEMDLAQRLAAIGHEVHLCADASAEHVVGASRATVPLRSHPELVTSTVKYLAKWRGRRAARAYRAAAVAIWAIAGATGRVDRELLQQRRRALDAGFATRG
jgi:N-acetylglucosaminyl-diphospho-decaprenol L-rhamnosyltransferase